MVNWILPELIIVAAHRNCGLHHEIDKRRAILSVPKPQ